MNWSTSVLVSNGAPRWLQLAEIFRRAIESGEFPVGATLPTEAEINTQFGVSRTTTRSAMQQLVQEGLIKRRAGIGSVVVDTRVDQPVNQIRGFAEDMRSRGMMPGYQVLGCGMAPASLEATQSLGLPSGDQPFYVERLLKANERLIGHSISWVRPDIFGAKTPPTSEQLAEGSLYEWLRAELGIEIVGGVEYIEASLATRQVCPHLDVTESDPVLVARRVARSRQGLPIEFAIVTYRSDRYRFRVDL
ncbi:GntR family transcriptional regulator [Ponticoccus alexandrii]|uniref:UTRA domain-containing protein n=1 Tax=Ponticoccus alexandrii TaxID=1943633 RepID=A0ABX7F7R0_9RHOB|nr:GntR family transcriptional regulator [Ponticoccus alexandrii]ETA51702.1 hypothetical protein P279_12645 [Rhodobacteraceae bacterium PD-2]QRF66576.1 UTRA domain-containing protein [Ponticoccus alexandrii]